MIVDMRNVDRTAYLVGLAECNTQYADRINVGANTAASAVAGAGAVTGASEGATHAIRERDTVLRNCLRERGYRVFN